MSVDSNDSWPKVFDTLQSKLQEVFGRDSVSVPRQHEVYGVAFRIRRSTCRKRARSFHPLARIDSDAEHRAVYAG